MNMATTMERPVLRVTEKRRWIVPRSQILRDKAGRVVRSAHTRKARAYAPLVSGKKLSVAKHTGGALGEVAVQMLALANAGDFEGVESYLTFVQGVRDSLLTDPGCPRELTMREQEVNADEDAASLEFINGGSPEVLAERVRTEIGVERLRYAALLREVV